MKLFYLFTLHCSHWIPSSLPSSPHLYVLMSLVLIMVHQLLTCLNASHLFTQMQSCLCALLTSCIIFLIHHGGVITGSVGHCNCNSGSWKQSKTIINNCFYYLPFFIFPHNSAATPISFSYRQSFFVSVR